MASNGTVWSYEIAEDDAIATDSEILIALTDSVTQAGGDDWHAFGVWMIVPNDRTLAADYLVGAFVDGGRPFSQNKLNLCKERHRIQGMRKAFFRKSQMKVGNLEIGEPTPI